MEENFLYVEVDGFIKLCDVHLKENDNMNKIYDNCSVYLKADKLSDLSKKIDDIKSPFILVSGNSDNENYIKNFHNYEQFEKFVSNDKIIHWFCQNSTVAHPKITNLPIGVAYNQDWMSNYYKDNSLDPPLKQEEILIKIKNESKPFYQRKNKCYINFKVAKSSPYKYDREEALQFIPDQICFKEKDEENRYECWKNQTNYAFVVSPFGVGLDCLRTWEALILGCIPIVRSSGIDKVFDDLPVLIIKDWKEVTQELLDKTISDFEKRTFNYEKLKLQYWKDKIDSYKKKEGYTNLLTSKTTFNFEIIYCLFFLFCIIVIFIIMTKKQWYNVFIKNTKKTFL
uniref:Exostosin GT47 domain-containing protein n=1 Tax=viral metagenome TaxID=1070528 RepID=A0A6C0B769_9ZZZZ